MRNVNAIVMNYKEFEELVFEASSGHVGIGFEHDGWFYTVDDEGDCDNINEDLSSLLGVTVKAARIDTTFEEDDVVIICE